MVTRFVSHVDTRHESTPLGLELKADLEMDLDEDKAASTGAAKQEGPLKGFIVAEKSRKWRC